MLMLVSLVLIVIAFTVMAAVTGLGRQDKTGAQDNGQQEDKLFHGVSFAILLF